MSCPGGGLTKNAPPKVERERVSSNVILRHLSIKSNTPPPTSSYLLIPTSHGFCRSGLLLCICQSEMCRGGREAGERWMAGEVSLMCAGPLTLPYESLRQPVRAERNPRFCPHMSKHSH